MHEELGYVFLCKEGEQWGNGTALCQWTDEGDPDKAPFQEQCMAKLGAQLGNTKPSQAGFLGFRPCNGTYHNTFCTTQVPLWWNGSLIPVGLSGNRRQTPNDTQECWVQPRWNLRVYPSLGQKPKTSCKFF